MSEESIQEELLEKISSIVGNGYLGEPEAMRVEAEIPGVEDKIVPLLGYLLARKRWGPLIKVSNIGSHLHVQGLGDLLVAALNCAEIGERAEDLVEILGDLRYAPAASPIFDYLKRIILREPSPYYGISVKCAQALGALGTSESREILAELTSDEWPAPVRWHAAVELGNEEVLGFDEETMLGGI
ncbi:hypothetical protein [Amycolatopsis sp. PS_44_ISF1]|uniref:HEAT repeat domain-containing protein n=1 Tax=Amycolatopsis sp. PS_44_ISF1 TaxID=2974917 RepID=UPI0028DFA7FA|nr:hypothetical protein [Amycolatopsis sp. PS_44_ISF1]MDT8914656.1 hypothetical protein [Amycolatopsis sp. PS_44_ISF1]